jgi:hypothetical protein
LEPPPPPKNIERGIYEYVHRKNKDPFFTTNKPIGAAPRGHFFVGGGGGVWAKKIVTLRGLRISEKKEILRKPTVDIVS